MRLTIIFGTFLGFLAAAMPSSAGAVADYNFGISSFVQSPTQPIVYGTVPSLNSIVAINTNTLQVTNTVPIGSNPQGITISPDGSTLYVADSGSSFIARVNTSTMTTLTPLVSPGGNPSQLQFGNSNRLWVLGGGGIHQIDATTGLSTGADLSTPDGQFPLIINSGNIVITPDKNTLFYGNYGLSPSDAYKFDVTTTTPQQISVIGGGGNGTALAVSHNGSIFTYSSAGDDGGLALRSTANTSLVFGSPITRGNGLAFSANDQLIYTAINFTSAVTTWSTSTYLQQGSSISTASQPGVLFTDTSGQFLFVGEGSQTEVFAVPEPGMATILIGALTIAVPRRRR